MWHWLQHIAGVDNVSGEWYGFWSGFAGDVAIIGAMIAFPWIQFRRHNCQVQGCWRIAHHEFTEPSGVKRLLCWRHHPDVKDRQLTREKLHLYLGDRPGRG